MGNAAATSDFSEAGLTATSFVSIGTLISFYVIMGKAGDIFVIANKSHKKTKMNHKFILTSIAVSPKPDTGYSCVP